MCVKVMDEEQRERLRLNSALLVEDLDVKDMMVYLFQEGVITQNVWDEIMATEPKTPATRTRKLIIILPKCGPKAYSVFRKALDKYNYSFLGQKLDETKVSVIHKDNTKDLDSKHIKNLKPSKSSSSCSSTSRIEPEDGEKRPEPHDAALATKRKKIVQKNQEQVKFKDAKKRKRQVASAAWEDEVPDCVSINKSSKESNLSSRDEDGEQQTDLTDKLTRLRNAKDYSTVAMKQPRKQLSQPKSACRNCPALKREILVLKRQLREALKNEINNPTAAYNRPRPGKVCEEDVAKYLMKELVPGSRVYIYEDQYTTAAYKFKTGKTSSRSGLTFKKNGKPAARYLLTVLFTKNQLENGTLSRSPKGQQHLRLDTEIVSAIRDFCIQRSDTPPAALNRAMYSKMSSMRWEKNNISVQTGIKCSNCEKCFC